MSEGTGRPTPNFDAVARLYRWAEYLALGRKLQLTRTHFVPQLTGCRRAVLFGDGDGRFLAELLRSNPVVYATAVDSSRKMLHLLRGRTAAYAARVTTCARDALTVSLPPDTDLLVTHFFLDCLSQQQVERLVARSAERLRPGALWLVSDFRVPPAGWLRWPAAIYIRSLYFVFRVLTGLRVTRLPDPRQALSRSGFRCLARHDTLGGMLYSELWRFAPSHSTCKIVENDGADLARDTE